LISLVHGGKTAAQGRSEIAGGQISAGEEVGYVLSGLLGGAGLPFLLRVEEGKVKEHKRRRSLAGLLDIGFSRNERFRFLEGLLEREADRFTQKISENINRVVNRNRNGILKPR
jgi:hypothetical protein